MIQMGTRILFIGPKFFGYEEEIKLELERAGCEVDWHDERPASTPLVKALIRFRPELIASMCDAYFDRIIDEAKERQFDVVFVIKGEALSVERLLRLRQCQPNARFIYYTWDSLKNVKNSRDKLAHFDKAYSFDRFDCMANQKVKHLPLFYVRAYEALVSSIPEDNVVQDIDLLFLGSIHSDRYAVAQRIFDATKEIAPNIKFYAYFFYQSRWVFALRKLADRQFRSIPWRDVQWHSLNLQRTLAFISRSKVMLDIHHPGQTGLTMRTIESIGVQRKIITTNSDVVNYDFYSPDNILVVDRSSPIVPKSFVDTPYNRLAKEVYKRYSLRSWLDEIFA